MTLYLCLNPPQYLAWWFKKCLLNWINKKTKMVCGNAFCGAGNGDTTTILTLIILLASLFEQTKEGINENSSFQW